MELRIDLDGANPTYLDTIFHAFKTSFYLVGLLLSFTILLQTRTGNDQLIMKSCQSWSGIGEQEVLSQST